jgi:RNA polymerase-binding protein DksA
MDKKTLDQIKAKLTEEKENLEKELMKIATQNPRNDADWNAKFIEEGNDEDTSADEYIKFDLNLTLEKTLEKSLSDVNKALASIKKNEYGICKYCKQPIDPKRLLARPTSSACINCKTKLKSL